MPPDLLTTRQVAALLGTNVRRVNRLVKAGKLPTVIKLEGITGANLFDPSDVDAYVARLADKEQLGGDAA